MSKKKLLLEINHLVKAFSKGSIHNVLDIQYMTPEFQRWHWHVVKAAKYCKDLDEHWALPMF